MDDKLKEIFKRICDGEAKAALRLKYFAKQAEKEDLPQIAHLFRAISLSEEIHGERALRMLKEIKDTEANLKESFDAETKVAGVAYDQFLKVAAELKDEISARIFAHSRDAEDIHANLYKKAMAHLMDEKDTTYYVCRICGYIADGSMPEACPICSAPKSNFVECA